MSLHRLGNIAAEQGLFDVAVQHFRKTLEARRAVLGSDHVDTIWSMSDLAGVLVGRGRAAEAEPLAREALDCRRRVQGPRHPDTLNAELCLATTLQVLGRLDEAEALHLSNIDGRREVYGPAHPATSIPIHWMAIMRHRQRRPADAAEFAEQAFEIRLRADGWSPHGTMESLGLLVCALADQGKLDEARQRLAPAHEEVDAARARGDELWMSAYLDALDRVGDRERKSRVQSVLAPPATVPATAPAR
jgi:tetratricopeptide (TPR) repeat protein